MKPLLNGKQAASLLGLHESWVLQEARNNRIPHVRFGKYVRFDEDALAAWAAAQMQGPKRAAPRPSSD